jgi:hypothetical protein
MVMDDIFYLCAALMLALALLAWPLPAHGPAPREHGT